MEGTGVHILVPALMIPDELFGGLQRVLSVLSNFGAIRTSLSGKCQSSTEATRVILCTFLSVVCAMVVSRSQYIGVFSGSPTARG